MQRTIGYEVYIICDRHVQLSPCQVNGSTRNWSPSPFNQYTVTDIFYFTKEIHDLKINKGEILVSYDVSSLFTNVPLDETIEILVNRALTKPTNTIYYCATSDNQRLRSAFDAVTVVLWGISLADFHLLSLAKINILKKKSDPDVLQA